MRTWPAIALGVVLGAALAGAMVVGFLRLWPGPSAGPTADASGTIVRTAGRPAVPPSAPSIDAAPATAPVTPAYGPRPNETPAIYRCRANGRTSYSNEPCPDADVVRTASAATGFESRPSERLGRLVADGRTFDPNPSSASSRVVAPTASSPSSDCTTWRRQIVDIDRMLAEPNATRTLDYWRQVRQDVRTSMARAHC